MRQLFLVLLVGGEALLFLTDEVFSQIDTAWVRFYDGVSVGTSDVGVAAEVDSAGNIFVTGTSGGDMATLKYDVSGNLLWARRFAGATPVDLQLFQDSLVSVLAWVTSGCYTNLTCRHPLLVRYDKEGNTLWIREFHRSNKNDDPRRLALGSDGAVYVGGMSYIGPESYATIYVMKYESNGDSAWFRSDTVQYSPEYSPTMGLTSDTGLMIVSFKSEPAQPGLLVRRYTSSGVPAWKKTIPLYSQPDEEPLPVDLQIIAGDSCVLVGRVQGECFVSKLDSGGNPVWSTRYAAMSGGDDLPREVVIDDQNCILVLARSSSGGGDYDYLTLRYSPEGSLLWARRYNGIGGWIDDPASITLDDSGAVYICGLSYGINSGPDIQTIKYDAQGVFRWENRLTSAGNFSDYGATVRLAPHSRIVVLGAYSSGSSNLDFCTIAYSQCDCPCYGDPACDGIKSDILDVVNAVNVAFRGVAPTTDPLCPRERTDVDCSGSTDVLDVVKTIDVAFRGGDATAELCQPCS